MELNESKPSRVAKQYKQFPFSIVNVDEDTQRRVLAHFKGDLAGLLQVGPEKWTMSKYYAENAEELYNFEALPDDIYISTFLRSGTTWTQEMIWLLCNDLNYEAAKATLLDVRFPFFELMSLFPKNLAASPFKVIGDLLPPPAPEMLAEMTSKRLIKTHLPIKMMPHDALEKNCKIVYVARNPKDVIVSCYHFVKLPAFMFDGSFEEFVEDFMDNLVQWGPYFEHIKDGWSRRNNANVLFLFYEDLIMDLRGSLKRLASFLERPLNDNDLPELMEHLNIKNFKKNTAVNLDHFKIVASDWDFVRRGQIGGNPEMTPQIIKKIDEWTEKNLTGSDLKFPHQTEWEKQSL